MTRRHHKVVREETWPWKSYWMQNQISLLTDLLEKQQINQTEAEWTVEEGLGKKKKQKWGQALKDSDYQAKEFGLFPPATAILNHYLQKHSFHDNITDWVSHTKMKKEKEKSVSLETMLVLSIRREGHNVKVLVSRWTRYSKTINWQDSPRV